MAAPAIGDAPPTASGIANGDSGVSTMTGDFKYSYPIAVPPGRNVQPRLALAYSSQASIYGTLAAGWSLSGGTVNQMLGAATSRADAEAALGAIRSSLLSGGL